jgi:hypothetical protein
MRAAMKQRTGREAVRMMADVVRVSAAIAVVIIDWAMPAPHNASNLSPVVHILNRLELSVPPDSRFLHLHVSTG